MIIANRIPYPLHNGEDLRTFQLASELARRHRVELFCYGDESDVPTAIGGCFADVHLVPESNTTMPRQHGLKRYVDALLPERMYHQDSRVERWLGHAIQARSYDLVWIAAWRMIPYSLAAGRVPVFIDAMDDGVLELAREIRHSRSLGRRIIDLKRLAVTLFFERRYFPRAKWCCLVSHVDAEVTRKICPRANVIVIPNGVDGSYYQPLGLPEEHPSLVFEGNMGFLPSIDAVRHFALDIFPIVKAEIPETKLYVVGKGPAAEIRALASNQIIITGFVEDVRPYVDRASVFVCPMRKGGGIKNKVLQAWAMGKPVVATPIALGGLAAQDGKNILIGRNPREFAAAVIKLLKDQELRNRVGRAALEIVRRDYTWEKQARSIEAALQSK